MKLVNNFDIGNENVLIVENQEIKGYYNVKEYGVVGDGTTDDSQAIQDLIDSIDKGTVFFPSGTYYIANNDITLKSDVNIIGDSATLSFNNRCFITADTDELTTPNSLAIKTNNVSIKNLKLDGNEIGLFAMKLSNINNLLIDNIEIVNLLDLEGTPTVAIYFQDNCHDVRIVNSHIVVSDYAIAISSEKMRQLRDTTEHNTEFIISNNNLEVGWGSCVGVNCAVKNLTINGNTLKVNGQGIGVKCGEGANNPLQLHVEDVVINGNIIKNENKVGHGIRVSQNVYSVNIENNVIDGFNESLWVSGNVNLDTTISKGVDIIFNGNKLINTNYGVYCYNNVSQPKITISNNTFTDLGTGVYGVFFWSPVSNNRFINNTKGIVFERAFFCNVVGNNFYSIEQTAIEYTTAENTTSNTSPVIIANIIEDVSTDGDGQYPAISINNLRAIISGNYINNLNNKGNYIIACALNSNNRIVSNNIYRGATLGFIESTGANDKITDNIILGSIG